MGCGGEVKEKVNTNANNNVNYIHKKKFVKHKLIFFMRIFAFYIRLLSKLKN